MTSPEAADSALVDVLSKGLRNGSSVVKTKTEMPSMIFSMRGPRPGIFSIEGGNLSAL